MENREHIIKKIERFAKNMRKHALDMALTAAGNSAHLGGGLSIIDITATLYAAIMRYNLSHPQWNERDRFILSKGHGVLGYYSALAEAGFIPIQDLLTFEKSGSYLLAHPAINKEKGIEFSTGSLGMGLSLGVGVALAGKFKKSQFKVYVLTGDGECNEGSIWEAAMAAAQFKLNNLTAIIDKNRFQQVGANCDIMGIKDITAAWRCFGWNAIEVDGHNIGELYDVFCRPNLSDKPVAIIANTVKGKGISFAENNNAWHHAILTKLQYEQAIVELNN